MTLLQQIHDKLAELGMPVYYARAYVDPQKDAWNYIVFSRDHIERSISKHSRTEYYRVAVVNEGSIPEGYDDVVKAKLEELEGMRIAGEDVSFGYDTKGSNGIVVEVMVMTFRKSEKR